MLQKDPSWWKSCKQPLKDASKTTLSLGWWEFIWDAPVWAQETMSFRTSTGGTLFPLPPKCSWLIAAGLWAPRSSSQHSCLKGGDENHSAWVGLLGLEKKRAAMCRMTYEDFLMKGWLLGAVVQLWLHSPWVTPGCAMPELREGRDGFYIRIWQGEGCTDVPICLGISLTLPLEGFLTVSLWMFGSSDDHSNLTWY